MPVSKANMRAVAKYVKNNYDNIQLRVKKGQRETISDYATKSGMSLNAYIKTAVTEKIKAENGIEIEL